jgi:two-component system sensor kinase FixL
LWATVRFGSRGAAAAISAVAVLAILGVAHGHGPFSERSAEENALSVQVFLIFMSVPLLFLAAIIAERDKAEETLRERDERINLAAESANLALWTIAFLRHESWMNEKGRELFGFAPNEPISREAFLSRVHPEDRKAVDTTIESARAGSQTFEIEYRLLRPDGETRWLISRGRYLRNDRGQLSELIGVAIDVTAQVKSNLELRLRREEMFRLSRVATMGELTASLAHELNQPLTAIASNAAAGKRFLARGSLDTKMFEELLSDVFTDARRAGDVIHGIHHLVRKGEGSRRLVNVNEIIVEVLRLLRSDLLGRATTVETNLASNLASVQADPIHLQQVLLNLIMNSLDAMHDTPAARRRIIIFTSAADGFVEVSVRDHGVGLPQDDPDKIFSHFFSTKPNGMGMGLTIVRSIVEGHGGELGADNLKDGARFFFRLPVV